MANTKGRILYRCPGPNPGPAGGYEWLKVAEADIPGKLTEGWAMSLSDAVEKYAAAKKTDTEPDTSKLSPAEKAQAAQKALTEAAEQALAAKRQLAADTEKADAEAAHKAEAEAAYQKASGVLDSAQGQADAAHAELLKAQRASGEAEKAKRTSQTRHNAAQVALNAAAGRVLMADKLLEQTTEKAMAEAEAAEEALKKAEGKKKTKADKPNEEPTAPTGDPKATPTPAPTASLDDVRTALTKLKDAKDTRAVTKLLKGFNVKVMADLKEAQYAAVIAAVDDVLKG